MHIKGWDVKIRNWGRRRDDEEDGGENALIFWLLGVQMCWFSWRRRDEEEEDGGENGDFEEEDGEEEEMKKKTVDKNLGFEMGILKRRGERQTKWGFWRGERQTCLFLFLFQSWVRSTCFIFLPRRRRGRNPGCTQTYC